MERKLINLYTFSNFNLAKKNQVQGDGVCNWTKSANGKQFPLMLSQPGSQMSHKRFTSALNYLQYYHMHVLI